MVTDARTDTRNYPKPHVDNTRGEEFARLITAMEMIDADMAAALVAIGLRALAVHGHAIADITGLQSALNGKAAQAHTHALAGLSDTGGLAAPTSGQVPIFLAGAWSLASILVSPDFTGTRTAPTAASGTNTTQIATTAFVKAALDAMLGAAPGQLDTLVELAAALGNDANFAATMTAALGGKQPLAAVLTSLAGVAGAATANKILKFTAANTLALDDPQAVLAAALAVVKGSMLVGSAPGTLAKISGTAGQVPTVQADGAIAFADHGWSLIGELNPAGAASISFTDLSAYSDLRLDVIEAATSGASAVSLVVQLSTDNGASWLTSGYVTRIMAAAGSSLSTGVISSAIIAGIGTVTNASAAGQRGHGTFYFHRVNDAAKRTTVDGVMGSTVTTDTFMGVVTGRHDTAAAHNALRVMMSSGTISGNFSLWGRK
jgi:hypothetical protein